MSKNHLFNKCWAAILKKKKCPYKKCPYKTNLYVWITTQGQYLSLFILMNPSGSLEKIEV